ncbi:hypothetical protein [Exiguobacterium sp. s150]|uniref:hypothetical protein n=1 Tax=Exiguobacterium sp. s150 TaxID=2751221 RepID=UPI001BE7F789|nr:hypothetical protein [Exiguobacterium sp. s150]
MAKKSFKLVKASAALAVTAAALTPVMAAEASTAKAVELKAEVVLGGKFKEALALNTPAGVQITWGKHLVTAINKWQTVTGKGSDGKTYIKKLYARNYPLYVLDQDLGEVEAGSELVKPSIRVMYRDGKIYTQAPERYTMSSNYNTKDEGEQKVLISYNHNGNRITKLLTYTVVAGAVEFSAVKSEVNADDKLVVTGEIAKAKEDTKAELLIFPGKDQSATPIKAAASIKDGKFTATSISLPAGTHSYKVVSGEVETDVMEFTVAATDLSVKAVKSNQLEVKFNKNLVAVDASDFKLDNGRFVTKAEIDATDKTKVLLTTNENLIDGETYKLTANKFETAFGEATVEIVKSFDYKVAKPTSVSLTKTAFLSGQTVLDSVVLKDENGLLLTEEALEDRGYELELSSTAVSTVFNSATGRVTYSSTPSQNTFFLEVKVLDSRGNVVSTTGATRVTVADANALVTLDGFHIDTDGATGVSAYQTAKRAGNLVSSVKRSDAGFLNLFVKDASGNLTEVSATGATITNLTPTVATVVDAGGNFDINQISTGTARVQIKKGDFETIVEFQVVADSAIANATLSESSINFDSGTVVSPDSPVLVDVDFLDQYKAEYTTPVVNADGEVRVGSTLVGTIELASSNSRVASAEFNADGKIVVSEGDREGNATISATFKDASNKVVFTKSIAVKRSAFDSVVAGYDLVISSANKVLDADVDTGNEINDDSVQFQVIKLDKFGNRLGVESGATLSVSYTTASHEDYLTLSSNTLSFNQNAAVKFAGTGKATVQARVGGVLVDTVSVDYTNTDSVAKKASVNTATRTIDLSNIGGTTVTLNELVFGKYDSVNDKYLLNSVVGVEDQFGKAIDFKKTNLMQLVTGVDVAIPNAVVTNLSNVTVSGSTYSLTDDAKAGQLTVVLPRVITTENGELLAAPVSMTVKLVK